MYVSSRVSVIQAYQLPSTGQRNAPQVDGPASKKESSEEVAALEVTSFPRSPDLTELAARLEPPERARQLALALDGPGMPVPLKLATLRMMLEGPSPLVQAETPRPEPVDIGTAPTQAQTSDLEAEALNGVFREAAETTSTADTAVFGSTGRDAVVGGANPPLVPATTTRSSQKSGSVIPPTLAAHVQSGAAGTPTATTPRGHIDLKG
jgi:hypothetical protein